MTVTGESSGEQDMSMREKADTHMGRDETHQMRLHETRDARRVRAGDNITTSSARRDHAHGVAHWRKRHAAAAPEHGGEKGGGAHLPGHRRKPSARG